MKKFKTKKIKNSNSSIKVLESVRNIKVDGFNLKKGFLAFQEKKTGEFSGFSSGWVSNGFLAVYVPRPEGFELKWFNYYDDSDTDSELELAIWEYGFKFLRPIDREIEDWEWEQRELAKEAQKEWEYYEYQNALQEGGIKYENRFI
ncbi:hypothetical protein [Peptostreptococcus sp. D1]|uniref:hypothetical protein n=1 Tax=Peptostreptococcus sp. D1 TaxID=72304 RepID=UPI0008E9C45D|nr:hypothetical protein [Peptostreptococcus sp. D1]SFE89361.1 hypothetical protein SAMN02910278_01980 [Peptostreptococcus sp. D1]